MMHLTDKHINGYIHQTLTDAQRESMDRHLDRCPSCRTRLDMAQQEQRHIYYELAGELRQVQPTAAVSFQALQPTLKRSRQLATWRRRSFQLLTSTAAIAAIVILGFALFYSFNLNPGPPLLSGGAADENALDFRLQRQPALQGDSVTTWKARLIHPGAVVFHDGLYHLYFDGSDGFPSAIHIGHAVSKDGLSWVLSGPEPVFSADDVTFTDFTLSVSSILVEEDGTWVMYFSTINQRGSKEAAAIGRATSPTPTGPWTPDPQPVLERGAAGTWNDAGVSQPSVVKTAEGYVMYYSAGQQDHESLNMIGMATSPDGIVWTKYDDPATSDPLYIDSDPVFSLNPERQFAGPDVTDPNVIRTDGGWLMAYNIYEVTAARTSIGFAQSEDGRHWRPTANREELSTDRDGWRRIYHLALIENDGEYFLYFDVQSSELYETDIRTATYTK